MRQSFLNGSLTRLLDPDAVLRKKIAEFVAKGDFVVGGMFAQMLLTLRILAWFRPSLPRATPIRTSSVRRES